MIKWSKTKNQIPHYQYSTKVKSKHHRNRGKNDTPKHIYM